MSSSINRRKMLTLPFWRAKQKVTTFQTSPLCSACRNIPLLWKRYVSINKRQENAVTSCLESETGCRNFGLHHCVWHPEKPPSCENGTDRSINGRQMLSLHVWRAKQEVTAFWTSPLCSASRETPSSNIWPVLLFVLPFGGSAFCLFTAPVIAIESQGKKLVSISNHNPNMCHCMLWITVMGCWGLQACLLCHSKLWTLSPRADCELCLTSSINHLVRQSRHACKPQQPMDPVINHRVRPFEATLHPTCADLRSVYTKV